MNEKRLLSALIRVASENPGKVRNALLPLIKSETSRVAAESLEVKMKNLIKAIDKHGGDSAEYKAVLKVFNNFSVAVKETVEDLESEIGAAKTDPNSDIPKELTNLEEDILEDLKKIKSLL